MATTTTTRKFDENGNPDGTTVVTTQDPVKDNDAFEEAEKKRLEAQQAQMRTDAAQNWEQYKTNFNAANNENTAGLAAAGKTVMDRAFIVHNAIQGVKSGELYGGDPKMGQRFVMNAVLGFGDAVAKARGIQLVSGDDKGSMKTGFDGKNFNLVFRTGSGQYVSKAVSQEQFSQQLVAKGYLDADWNKPKDDAGKGAASKPEKPAAEPKPTDWSAHYNRFFENDVGEDGKALASGSRHLTKEGYANLELDLETATGDQKDYIARTLADADAKEAERAWKKDHDGEDELDQSQNPYKSTFLASYAKYNPKQEEGGRAGATPPPSAPNPEGPDDPLAAAFGMDKEYADKFNEAQQARTDRLNQTVGERSVYYNGQWIKAKDLPKGAKTSGVFTRGASPEAIESRRIAQEMTRANYEKNRPQEQEPLVSDDERVKGLDEMLDRYGREDDEAYDRQNADYFDKDGAQLDPSEVTMDANGNLVDKNGDPVRKEIWDDGTWSAIVRSRGGGNIPSPRPGSPQNDGTVEYDRSEQSKTQSDRNEEIFDAVMRMLPETRRRIAEETDGRGNLTERAKAVRNAILDYVDNENKRDSEASIHQNGAVQNSDGSFSRTYRDSKGGLVMEETFGSDRLTEQGREARLNALLDAEIDPETGIADTRGDAERMSRTERSEHGKSVDRRRAQIASVNARLEEADRKLHNDALREEGWMTEEDIENKEREQYLANPRSDVSENVANAEEMQSAANAGRMTASERQRREWANRDRSKDSPASEPPAPEPPASEPENKSEPKPEPNPYGKEPLPEDPTERQEAVRSDKNYKSIVESEDGDGGYVLTDRAMSTLRQKGIPVGYMTRDRVQNWIHNGDKYLDKLAAALKRIEANNKAANEREKARAREEVRRNQEAQQRSMTATSVNRLIAGAGIDITRQSDEDLLRLFPKKAEYEYAIQLRDSQRKQKKTVR